MTDRDAFGNLIENDRGAAAAPSAAPPVPSPLGEPATTTPPPAIPWVPFPNGTPATPAPERVRGSFDLFDKLVGLFFVAIFVVPLAIGGWVAYSAFHGADKATSVAIKGVERSLTPTTPTPGAGAGEQPTPAAPKPPTGLGAHSLLRPAALGRVLAAARRDPGGRLRLLRLAPDRANLQLARRGGGLDLLELRWDGSRSLIRSPGTPPGSPIVFSAVDRSAPQRLVRAAARRIHRSPGAFDYVVLIDIGGSARWSAYFKGGASFLGDAHGHLTQRIS